MYIYLYGTDFDLVTYYKSLAFLKAAKHLSGKFARWATQLADTGF
jgi:hypothetical protein